MRILVVEDDRLISEAIEQRFIDLGHGVDCAYDGAVAFAMISHTDFDLVILDLNLPNKSGEQIIKRIRQSSDTPVLILTARSEVFDRIQLLDLGADDYLCKPIKPRVLLAHIRAQLRRHTHISQQLETNIRTALSDELEIDATTRKVSYQQQEISLTCAEFDLLWVLASHAGRIISRDELHQEIFRLAYDGLDRSIDLRISRLRKKLSDNSKEPNIIKTIRNKGYLLAK